MTWVKHLVPSRCPGLPYSSFPAVLVLSLVVLAGLGTVAPPALAADGDSHYALTFTVHEGDTADMSVVFAEEGMSQAEVEKDCDDSTASLFESGDVDVTPTLRVTQLDGMPACSVSVAGMTFSDLRELTNDLAVVTHSEGTYEVVVDVGDVSDMESFSVSVEFPGNVEEVSPDGSVDGTTVRWDDVASDAKLRATASDSPGLPWVWILVGAAVVLVVVGVVVALLVVRRRRARAAGQPQQPGYGPPAGPGPAPVGGQPGQVQPGYVAQPEAPGVPPRPGQVPPAAPYVPGQVQTPGASQPPVPPSSPSGQVPGQGDYPPQAPQR